MYNIQVDHRIYTKPLSLVEAMRELYGCGNARIVRSDGTLVVAHAGSAYSVYYMPKGREVIRGRARSHRRPR